MPEIVLIRGKDMGECRVVRSGDLSGVAVEVGRCERATRLLRAALRRLRLR